MIKVLQIDSYSGIGGGEVVMFSIVKGLRHKFKFIIAAPQGEFLHKYQALQLKTYPLPSKNFILSIKSLRHIFKTEMPQIVHCHGTRAAIWTRVAVIGLRKKPKLVYTLHGFHIIRKPLPLKWTLVFLEKILNHWTDALVCVSQADKRLVLRYHASPLQKIRVILNGINLKKYQISQAVIEKTKKELGLKKEFVLSSIGRLHPQKDVSTILRAIKILKEKTKMRNFILLIIGDGPLKETLQNEAKNLGVKKMVRFLGFRKDIPVLLALSDVIILSTHWEGLPLVPIETGASKKPIIASDVEGVRETIINSKTGFLFQPKSAKDLARKILKLYSSEELRKKMGQNSFQFVSRNFNKKRMIQQYSTLYLDLCQDKHENSN